MSKDKFKDLKARHTGASLLDQDKELINEMNAVSKERQIEEPKTHSLTILPSHIEKIRNYVHYRKINGEPYYTQGKMLQEAIDLFLSELNIDIPDRPADVKRAEKKRIGRKSRKGNLNQNFTI